MPSNMGRFQRKPVRSRDRAVTVKGPVKSGVEKHDHPQAGPGNSVPSGVGDYAAIVGIDSDVHGVTPDGNGRRFYVVGEGTVGDVKDIEVDPSGWVYITGTSYVGRYDGAGSLDWRDDLYDATPWDCDFLDGYVAVGDTSNEDDTVTLHAEGGTLQFDSSAGGGQYWSVSLDTDQNVYAGGTNGRVEKFDFAGNLVWQVTPSSSRIGGVVVFGKPASGIYALSFDGHVYHLDPTTGSLLSSWQAHSSGDSQYGLDVNKHGVSVTASQSSGEVKKWDESRNEMWSWTPPSSGATWDARINDGGQVLVACDTDGAYLLTPDGGVIWSFSTGGECKAAAFATGRTSHNYSGPAAASSHTHSLDGLNDVSGTPSDGDHLGWDGNAGTWMPTAPPSGGGASTLDGLDDVSASSPSNGDHIEWDGTAGEWVSAAPPSGGGTSHVAVSVYANAHYSVSSATWTQVTFNTVESDANGLFDDANNQIVVDRSGWWMVALGVGFEGNSGGERRFGRIDHNGSGVARVAQPPLGNNIVNVVLFTIANASAGDAFTAMGWQDSGSTIYFMDRQVDTWMTAVFLG